MNNLLYICLAFGGLVVVFMCSLLYVLTNTIIISFGDDFQLLVQNMNQVFSHMNHLDDLKT